MVARQVRKYVTLLVLLLVTSVSVIKAQDYDPNGKPHEDKGVTASELVSGSSTNINGMATLDTSIGYNFTKSFGFDVGIPYLFDTRPGIFTGAGNRPYYVSSGVAGCTGFFGCYAGLTSSSRIWAGELADGYAELHYTRPYKRYNFLTNVTGDVPTASYRKGLTTGRVQWDWFNHIDTDIHGFDPFVNFGIANGRMSQHFLPRPYDADLPFRTFGYMSDFEGGLQYKVFRRFTLGASMWDILPYGPQRIYSNLVWEQAGIPVLNLGGPTGIIGTGITGISSAFLPVAPAGPGNFGYVEGSPNHGRYWNEAFETVGPNYIDRDNGYSATLAFSPFKQMDVLVGYNHSVRYNLDTVSVTLAFNANAVFRKLTNY
jgi:hypothetical protein